jgi:parvulin-like peptidyl-prolyl isomerase
MRYRSRIACAILIALLALAGTPAQVKLPLVDGKEALATVNGVPVTRAEFEYQVMALHASVQVPQGGVVPKADLQAVLHRMINAKLMVQEAQNIGLDEQPYVKTTVDAFAQKQMQRLVLERQAAQIARPDPARVERLYRKATMRYRISSLLVEKEDEAKRFDAAIRAGADYEKAAREAVAAGRAKQGDDGIWLAGSEMLPEVYRAVSAMKPGQTSAPIRVGKDFVLVKLFESKAGNDPEARKKAEADALKEQKVESLQAFTESLKARYAKIDKKVLDGIDYDAPNAGFEAYLKDERVVARVQGEAPITVAKLTEGIEKKFFHDPGSSVTRKRFNQRKTEILDELLLRALTNQEGRRLKIDQSGPYRDSVRGFRDEILFSAFVAKAIDPGIKADDATLQKYYDEHRSQYTSPEMLRIRGIAFAKRNDADAALAKLRRAAEFDWVAANAEGRLDPKTNPNLLEIPKMPVAVTELSEGVAKALSGAKTGDYRLYEDPAGPVYVLQVRDAVPSQVEPFRAVRGDVEEKVRGKQRQAALEEWAAKLRKAYEVKEFVTADQLARLLREGPAPKK